MKFPKKLFVTINDEGTEDQYFAAEADCVDLAGDAGDQVEVGIYELVSTGKLATKAEFIADKTRGKVPVRK